MTRSQWLRWMPAILICFSILPCIQLAHVWYSQYHAWSTLLSKIEDQKQCSNQTRTTQIQNRWLAKQYKGKDSSYFEKNFTSMNFLHREKEAWEALCGNSQSSALGQGSARWEHIQKQNVHLDINTIGQNRFLKEVSIETPSAIKMDLNDLSAVLALIEQAQGLGPILWVKKFEIKRVEVEQSENYLCQFNIIKRILSDE